MDITIHLGSWLAPLLYMILSTAAAWFLRVEAGEYSGLRRIFWFVLAVFTSAAGWAIWALLCFSWGT
jgi:hypothetical protein